MASSDGRLFRSQLQGRREREYCRDWRVVGLIRRLAPTTYKIHYVNYNLGRIVDNGSSGRCPTVLTRFDLGTYESDHSARSPSNTIRPSPASVGSHFEPSRRSVTRNWRPDLVASAVTSPASFHDASKIAVAIAPVPHARVSPSTPRSNVRIAHPPPRLETKFAFTPFARHGDRRSSPPRVFKSTALTSSHRTTRCGTPASANPMRRSPPTNPNGTLSTTSVTAGRSISGPSAVILVAMRPASVWSGSVPLGDSPRSCARRVTHSVAFPQNDAREPSAL